MKDKITLSGQEKKRNNIINSIERTTECMTNRTGLPFIMKLKLINHILYNIIYCFYL